MPIVKRIPSAVRMCWEFENALPSVPATPVRQIPIAGRLIMSASACVGPVSLATPTTGTVVGQCPGINARRTPSVAKQRFASPTPLTVSAAVSPFARLFGADREPFVWPTTTPPNALVRRPASTLETHPDRKAVARSIAWPTRTVLERNRAIVPLTLADPSAFRTAAARTQFA